ncbi:ribonuclease P protein component [Butyrivibrio sp. NC3005]|uniref:ribonuclease P protein component n=1 Tax=Butyrivibrio sp. NC3005 TaxID=1280685 RepID=UPI00040DD428|nr:ribonuclease P protein component [Butyrivibrio sp. NC3005]
MESLKKTEDFRNVYTKGRSFADRNLVVYVWKNGLTKNRLGISCSKKIGNSVVRHHFARLIREITRLHEEAFHSGWDVVVVARFNSKQADYHQLEASFIKLAEKAHLTKNNERV